MKILYTATVLSHICQFHLPHMKHLQEQGWEVHVAAHDNLAVKNGLQLRYCDKFIETPFSRSPKNPDNFKAYKQLKKLLGEEHYDVILCNTPMGGIVTRLAAKKARKQGTKVVYMAHGFHFFRGSSKAAWLIYYPIEKHMAKYCDLLITINEEDYEASPEYKLMTEMQASGLPTIVLAHLPDTIIFAHAYDNWDIDLFLSGHTHGGVIRVPWFGGVYAPMQGWFPEYDAGYFAPGKVQLVISAGLAGHGYIPRIFNRPEVCILHIQDEE